MKTLGQKLSEARVVTERYPNGRTVEALTTLETVKGN